MWRLRFNTAGESHGRAIVGIVEGIPAGLAISPEDINRDLKRRQKGYGRGGRMKIEADIAEILSGVRWGSTMGSPITILIKNKDWENWKRGMSIYAEDKNSIPPVTRPRAGHADLAGALKYNQKDIRNILERSSARETAMRVALGGIAKRFLSDFGIEIGSYVLQIGKVKVEKPADTEEEELFKRAEDSIVRCFCEKTTDLMKEEIDRAMENGDSLGGVFEVFVKDVPPGIGDHTQWDRRIDGRIAQALMSIQAIKGVEIGGGFALSSLPGSSVMDEIFYSPNEPYGFYRRTNNAGGIEGGMTNGMTIIVRGAMKPIPTLKRPLNSVDILTKEPVKAAYERSDVCAVPSASVIAESMVGMIIADAFLEKFGGDSMEEVHRNYESYIKYLKTF